MLNGGDQLRGRQETFWTTLYELLWRAWTPPKFNPYSENQPKAERMYTDDISSTWNRHQTWPKSLKLHCQSMVWSRSLGGTSRYTGNEKSLGDKQHTGRERAMNSHLWSSKMPSPREHDRHRHPEWSHANTLFIAKSVEKLQFRTRYHDDNVVQIEIFKAGCCNNPWMIFHYTRSMVRAVCIFLWKAIVALSATQEFLFPHQEKARKHNTFPIVSGAKFVRAVCPSSCPSMIQKCFCCLATPCPAE